MKAEFLMVAYNVLRSSSSLSEIPVIAPAHFLSAAFHLWDRLSYKKERFCCQTVELELYFGSTQLFRTGL